MLVKEWIFDRIEQSFNLLFSGLKNFSYLVFPIYIYKLIFWVIIWNFVSYVLLWNLDLTKTDIFSSPYYLIIFFFIIVWFLLYITFSVWFLLATIKTIKDVYKWIEVNIKQNIIYGFNSIIPSFETYWHIFAYIVLIPFYIISAWWVLFIVWNYLKNLVVTWYWLKVLFFGLFVLLIFMIYRWIKIKFSISSAVDNNHYTKDDFKKSVVITDNNWWRIVWNFLIISILFSIVFSIIWVITWMFKTWIFDILNLSDIATHYSNWSLNKDYIDSLKQNIMTFSGMFYLNNFIMSFFDLFFDTTRDVFILVFTYLFYKRLFYEKFWDSTNKLKEDIEL